MLAMTQEGCRRLVPLARCYQPPAPAAGGRRPAAAPSARELAPPPPPLRRLSVTSSSGSGMDLQSAQQPPRKLKLESEDSSYDSDSEAPPPPPQQAADHADVSRTVSDTLGAEFAEYVTSAAAGAGEPSGYTARVEFACKLGYTEEHVQRALRKLGGHPGENDFLEELIRVGKDAKSSGDVEEFEDTANSVTTAVSRLRVTREPAREEPGNLRHIVVDGSNVAMSHGNKERFSCRGIRLAVEYFRARGHQGITVFVPNWRKEAPRPDTPITDQEVLLELEREGILVFTPSRVVDGKRITCYDDRYILHAALDEDGVVVSNDNYRDLHKEKQFKKIIEERILMYSFANDKFMPPDDPLGRNGPTLDNFLRKTPRPSESLCPYGKKCTYGNKCKYYHPERGNQPQKTVTEKLAEHAQRNLQGRRSGGDNATGGGGRSVRDKTLSLPGGDARPPGGQSRKQPVSRTRSLVPGSVPADSRTGAAGPAAADDGSQLRAAAPKSRSMENVSAASRLRSVPIDPASYDPAAAAAVGVQGAAVPGHEWSHWPASIQQANLHTKAVRDHMELCRKSSDPSYQSSVEVPRPHKPLARQLTLNPAYDPRLAARDRYVLELEAQLGRQHLLASRNLLSPHWDAAAASALHQTQPPQHASVTRIASAPDSCRQAAGAGPAPPLHAGYAMHRLSSTSDPQLNTAAFPYQYPAPATGGPDPAWHPPVSEPSTSGWPQVSAHQPQPPPQTFNLFNPNPLTASLSTPPLGGSPSPAPGAAPSTAAAGPGGSTVAPAGGAQFGVLGFGAAAGGYTPDPIGTQPSSPRQSKEEQRRRMYWHLSALFPEEKVRVAMNLMPDETDPTKICAEILQPK